MNIYLYFAVTCNYPSDRKIGHKLGTTQGPVGHMGSWWVFICPRFNPIFWSLLVIWSYFISCTAMSLRTYSPVYIECLISSCFFFNGRVANACSYHQHSAGRWWIYLHITPVLSKLLTNLIFNISRWWHFPPTCGDDGTFRQLVEVMVLSANLWRWWYILPLVELMVLSANLFKWWFILPLVEVMVLSAHLWRWWYFLPTCEGMVHSATCGGDGAFYPLVELMVLSAHLFNSK